MKIIVKKIVIKRRGIVFFDRIIILPPRAKAISIALNDVKIKSVYEGFLNRILITAKLKKKAIRELINITLEKTSMIIRIKNPATALLCNKIRATEFKRRFTQSGRKLMAPVDAVSKSR